MCSLRLYVAMLIELSPWLSSLQLLQLYHQDAQEEDLVKSGSFFTRVARELVVQRN